MEDIEHEKELHRVVSVFLHSNEAGGCLVKDELGGDAVVGGDGLLGFRGGGFGILGGHFGILAFDRDELLVIVLLLEDLVFDSSDVHICAKKERFLS